MFREESTQLEVVIGKMREAIVEVVRCRILRRKVLKYTYWGQDHGGEMGWAYNEHKYCEVQKRKSQGGVLEETDFEKTQIEL